MSEEGMDKLKTGWWPSECGRMLTFHTVNYGQLVDVYKHGGIACGCKIHMFHPKGVFVGREFVFVPYHKIREHPKGLCWEQKFIKWGYGKKSDKRTWRQFVFESACRSVTVLMRWTQTQFFFDIIKSGKFQALESEDKK